MNQCTIPVTFPADNDAEAVFWAREIIGGKKIEKKEIWELLHLFALSHEIKVPEAPLSALVTRC